MKATNIKLMRKLDPEDIREAKGDYQREVKRKAVIRKFLWWSTSHKDLWTSQNNDERIAVKR